MKRVYVFLTAILILLSSGATAQTKSGFEYFKGKWNINANGPTGDVKMIVGFEKINDAVVGTIKDSEGKEMFKVIKTSILDTQATVCFIGSQGDVCMVLSRKDEDHLSGDIMNGMVSVSGERFKENK